MSAAVRRLLLITGMSGSGKTTSARVIGGFGYDVITMGDVIRDLATSRGLEPTPGNLGRIATEIRREGGDAAVARRCIDKIKESGETKVIVDGIRSLQEVEAFRAASEATLIAIHASPRTRFSRIRGRGRSDDPMGWGDFVVRDNRELGFGVGSAIAMADQVIVNEGSLRDLEGALKGMMARIEPR